MLWVDVLQDSMPILKCTPGFLAIFGTVLSKGASLMERMLNRDVFVKWLRGCTKEYLDALGDDCTTKVDFGAIGDDHTTKAANAEMIPMRSRCGRTAGRARRSAGCARWTSPRSSARAGSIQQMARRWPWS